MQHSKQAISNPTSNRLLDLLTTLLLRKNKNEILLVLHLLFSEVERMMILKRVGIQYMLLKQNERSIICELLKVSSSTVAYYAAQLENQKDDLSSLLKSVLLSEKMKSIFEDIVAGIIIQPNLYGTHKKIQAKYKLINDRKKYL